MALSDLELVAGWLGQPHVARWYLAGSTVERELGDLRRSITGEEPARALMVLEDARAIGWCQWYLCRDYPDHAAAVGAAPGDIGIDYAIGDPTRVGRGMGTALIAALVDHVRRSYPSAGVVADPESANLASRRALERNSFALVMEGPVSTEPTDAVMAVYRLPPPSLWRPGGGLSAPEASR